MVPSTVVQPHEMAKRNVSVLRGSSVMTMIKRAEVQQGYGGVEMGVLYCGNNRVI